MRHRFRTLVLLLIIGIAATTFQPSANLRAASAPDLPVAAATSESIELSASIGGASTSSALAGSLLYINEYDTLTIVDVSDPDQPVRRSSLRLAYPIYRLDVLDGFAYLSLSDGKLQIVDVHNPDQPVLRGMFQADGFIHHIQAQTGLVYIAVTIDDYMVSQFQVVDVSNPDLPVRRGKYRGANSVHDFQVVGNRAYLAVGYMEGIHILDVSNPAQLTLRGRYLNPPGIYVLSVVDHFIYALSGITANDVLIIDATDPSAPALRGTYQQQGVAFDDVEAEGSMLYLVEFPGKVHAVDVSNPASPTLRGAYPTPYSIYNLNPVNQIVYLQLNTDLAIVDFSNPGSPTLRGKLTLSQNIISTRSAGNLAFSAVPRSGLHIFDTSDPAQPVLRGVYRDTDTTSASDLSNVAVRGSFAYLASSSVLKTIDVGDPASPALRSEYEGLNGFPRLHIAGDRLYVSADNRLYIFDIATPSTPTLLADQPIAAAPIQDFKVVGNRAYILTSDCSAACIGALHIIDVGNPGSLVPLGSLQMNSTSRLSVVGNAVYVGGVGVQIIDVSDPARPQLRNIYRAAGEVTAIDIVDGLMYVIGQGGFSLQIADLTDPYYPRPRASYPLQGYTADVHVADDLVYASAGNLFIFRVHAERFPGSIFVPLLAKPATT
ncbi:MAG TPA: hypothetical protein VGD69_25655 [Herpetosiphonaceae bacterium]